MTVLTLGTLGRFHASLGQTPLTDFRTRKVQALLIYLATEPRPQRRDLLMSLLWPGMPERSARSNLRQVLYYLRQVLPEVSSDGGNGLAPVIANRQHIQLNPQGGARVDTQQLEALLARAHSHEHLDLSLCQDCAQLLEEAVSLYRGDFLADFYLDDSGEYEEWAQARREYYRRQVLDALAILTTMALRRRDFAAAERYAAQQVDVDNLRESGYRQLMEALALRGRREQALAVYEACRRVLAEELSMAPAARTTAYYDKVVAGELQFDRLPAQGVRGYELKEPLGEGSYGTLYRAVQPAIMREVAVKVIRRQYADNPEFIRRFEAEAQTVARLEHPHIVPLYDYWRDPDGAYLVMRYMRGGSLLAALKAGPWSAGRAAALLEQVAGSLAYAHHHGVVHRDIKPGNILLDGAGNAYLADFGIARELKRGEQAAAEATVASTLDYASPEQILGEPVTPQTDIYSLGAVLYETLTGEKPFGDATVPRLLYSQLNEPIPLVADSRPDISAEVDAVLQKATAKKPAARYATPLEMAVAFRSAVDGAGHVQEIRWREELVAPLEVYNPYKGLQAFQESDAAHFFGREALVQQLVARLGQTAKGQDGRFLAVVGPSGSGKSSVVKAGLIPALRDGALPGSDKWYVTEMVPGTDPFQELELALWRVAVDSPPDLVTPMQRDRSGILRTLRRILPAEPGLQEGRPQLLLVVDQFEELFTLVDDEDRRALFLDSLLAALAAPHSPLRLVITLRADFYDRPLQQHEWGNLLKQNTEVVLPLNSTELTWAVREPARTMGVRLEEGLESTIIAAVVDRPGALPLLQYVLTELFERREGGYITRVAYDTLGGVHGALGRRAEILFTALDEAGQETARQLFLRLVTLGEGSEDTRRRVLRAELEGLAGAATPHPGAQATVDDVLTRFGAARFLTFDHDPVTRAPTVEVAHEALLREWPRLRGWLAESRDDLRLQRLLAQAAGEWQAAGRDPGYLLRHARLDQFAGWAAGTSVALTEGERALVVASIAAREQRLAAEDERQQRELQAARDLAEAQQKRAEEQASAAQRLRRRALYLAAALVVAALLAVLALGAGRRASANAVAAQASAAQAATSEAQAVANAELAAAGQKEAESERQVAVAAQATAEAEALVRAIAQAEAVHERETAEQQRALFEEQARLATSRELSLAALNTLPLDPELSILLALQALDTAHTQAAEDALHRAVQHSRLRSAIPDVWNATFHPDGTQVATLGEAGLQVWDLAADRAVLTIAPPVEAESIAYSPGGDWLVTGHEDGSIILWDASTGGEQRFLQEHRDAVYGVGFSPDGRLLASTGAEGVTILWDLDSGAARFTFPGTYFFWSVAVFSPDGRLLAVPNHGEGVAAADAKLNLWDTESGTLRLTLMTAAPSSAFSPDGAFLATGSSEGVAVWHLAAGPEQAPITLAGHTSAFTGADFRHDGALIATTSQDGTAKVWDPATGEEHFTLAGHTSSVGMAGFSPDGRRLLTVASDGARIWDVSLPGNEEVMALPGPDPTGDVSLALGPDGTYLALGGVGGKVHLHDAGDGKLLAVLVGHTGGVRNLAFSPDGSRLATAGSDSLVKVWDVGASLASGQGQNLLTLKGHEEAVSGGVWTGVASVAYSPGGARLATAGTDGTVRLWDAVTGDLLHTVELHPSGAQGVTFSPDGQYLAAGSDIPDAIVRVWRLAGDELVELYTLSGFPSRVIMVKFSPDGAHLVTSGANAHLALWDALTGEPLGPFSGHVGTVHRVAFSPDGRTLVSSSLDATIRLWDVASRTNRLILSTQLPPNDVAFSPDGAYLYASDRSGGLQVYAVELETLVSLAHERLTRWFTPDECLQYLHTDSCPEKPPGVR